MVVLAANGRGFCAGHHLNRSHVGDQPWQRRLLDDCSRMMMALNELPQPVIARVHGVATKSSEGGYFVYRHNINARAT